MELFSRTGWLGNYKVSHIFPLNNADEYLTVESHEGFPHVTLHNTSGNTIDIRTSGNFEVRFVRKMEIKSRNLHCVRGITPKHVMSGGIYFRGLMPRHLRTTPQKHRSGGKPLATLCPI